MALEFKKAKRSVARVKIAIGGVSGSGKTMSSLLMAFGLVQAEHPQWSPAQCWEHICIIDTENSSGSLYVGSQVGTTHIGEYNTIDIEPPFEAQKYIDAVHLAEANDQSVIIIDSMSHMWAGSGAALERQSQIAARTGNSYTAWAPVKKEIKAAMDAILQSPSHVIADFRAKQEYVQEKNERGKTVVRNVGLGFVFQDGMEFEFTSLFYLDNDHVANATKDRTGIFTGKFFTITPDTGKKFHEWLSAGAPTVEEPVMQKASENTTAQQPAPAPVNEAPAAPQTMTAPASDPVPPAPPADDDPFNTPDIPEMSNPAPTTVTMEQLDTTIRAYMADKTPDQRRAIGDKVKEICGTKNYKTLTDPAMIQRLYNMFNK